MRDVMAPDFIAGKARFLHDLAHSWEGALVKAEWYASFEAKKPGFTVYSPRRAPRS